jgi:hypothetical protein
VDVSGPDRLLFDRIVASLKSDDQQFTMSFDGDDAEGISKVRSLGRRAGRELGWKVRTFATNPDRRADRRVTVFVVVEESTPLRDELMRIRGQKKNREAMKGWLPQFGEEHRND